MQVTNRKLTTMFTMTIDAIGTFLNTVLVFLIILDPLKILRKGAWITILNLAIADCISCVANFLDVGLISEFGVADSLTLRFVRFHLIFGVSASFILLTLLSVETYIVTKYPIKARALITRRRTAMTCMVAWFLAVLAGLSNIAYVFTNNFRMLMKIYIAQIAVLELAVFIQVILKFFIIREIMISRQNSQQQQSQGNKHKEVAKTIITLNVILLVTALPYFVAKQLEFLWKLGLIIGDDLVWQFSNYYEPVAAINYLANPVLYALRLPNYRRTLCVLFVQCTGKWSSFFCRLRRSANSADATRAENSLQQSTITRL